ncbi:MAG TPA: hypothetical protein VF133_09315 [Terriglobales bacterium]
MTTSRCGSHSSSSAPTVKFLFLGTLLILGVATASLAQRYDQLPDAPVSQLLAQTSPPSTDSSQQTPSAQAASVTIPAGTRLQLVLTHPVDSNSTPRGDQIFAQTTAPVILGDQVVIPGGTYVQGVVEKLRRRGTQAEMAMQSVSLVFPNGYIASAGGPVKIQSEQWTAWNNPQGGSKAAIILAPILGLGLGTGIGAATDHARTFTLGGGSMPGGGFGVVPGPMQPVPGLTVTQNSHKGLMIGSAVGGAVGMITSFTLMARNRQFYIQEGSPMVMALPQPITLARAQIDDANQKAANQPPPPTARRTLPVALSTGTDHGTCYMPGTPGTPDVVIPGTPPVGNSPGTPPTVIPGIPPAPPTPYPCP